MLIYIYSSKILRFNWLVKSFGFSSWWAQSHPLEITQGWRSSPTVHGRHPAKHTECMEPCNSWAKRNQINWLAGFLPSTVVRPKQLKIFFSLPHQVLCWKPTCFLNFVYQKQDTWNPRRIISPVRVPSSIAHSHFTWWPTTLMMTWWISRWDPSIKRGLVVSTVKATHGDINSGCMPNIYPGFVQGPLFVFFASWGW